MKKQVAVVPSVNAAFLVQKIDVRLQIDARQKIFSQAGNNFVLVGSQLVRICAVNRRKFPVELVNLPAEIYCAVVEINLVKQAATVHFKIGVAQNHLPFKLEHNHQTCKFGGAKRIFFGIKIRRKNCQRAKTDTVAALQNVCVVVVQRIAHDRRDTNFTAESRAHPNHVMIAPLNIEFFGIIHQKIQNRVGTVSPVEEVADQMQAVNCQPLYQRRQRLNKIRAAVYLDNRTQKFFVVNFLRVV